MSVRYGDGVLIVLSNFVCTYRSRYMLKNIRLFANYAALPLEDRIMHSKLSVCLVCVTIKPGFHYPS